MIKTPAENWAGERCFNRSSNRAALCSIHQPPCLVAIKLSHRDDLLQHLKAARGQRPKPIPTRTSLTSFMKRWPVLRQIYYAVLHSHCEPSFKGNWYPSGEKKRKQKCAGCQRSTSLVCAFLENGSMKCERCRKLKLPCLEEEERWCDA